MRVAAFLVLLVLSMSIPQRSFATEEYAQKTGKECGACHVDPAGGGELTAAGKEYGASLAGAPQQEKGTLLLRKGVHLAAGYVHLLTAILWFGTILYVHLVLKPQYAAGGLPKGEVRVGVLSMVVIALSGLVLMHFRVTSLDMLWHTRFGILLLAKIILYMVMVLAAVFVVLFIGPRLKGARRSGAGAPPSGPLTTEELSQCDGAGGRPAYFAFRGKIYDATSSRLWKDGVHMGRHHAGEDLTEMLNQAPHGADQVTALPVVGELVTSGEKPAPHVRVFFVLAYLNLSIVFVIVFIVSLWRWW